MKENFLHYLWQYQQFDTNNLQTNQGQSVTILKKGYKNTDSGPDFDNCRIVIDGIEWAGKVEIHIRSSDWEKHKHQHDPNYENVILHVVWEDDKDIFRKDGSQIPSFSLKNRANKNALEKYNYLMENEQRIPCEKMFEAQSDMTKFSMIEKALAHRLERKSGEVLELYKELNNDFEEAAYQVLMRNFGFKLNAEPFQILAKNLPLKIIAKHRGQIFQIEALLFGQAGFLDNPENEYAQKLSDEYRFLSGKYGLQYGKMDRKQWKFMRTRPQNFPTVRLAEVAAILNQSSGLFNLFIENTDRIKDTLQAEPSEYWKHHYDWNKPSGKPNRLGKTSLDNILINTAAPLLASYYYITDNYSFFEKALNLLEKVSPEKNYITRIWDSLGLKSKSAFDSQALIEQYNEFCKKRKCLSCVVGVEILSK